jgi:hypothetical protein
MTVGKLVRRRARETALLIEHLGPILGDILSLDAFDPTLLI